MPRPAAFRLRKEYLKLDMYTRYTFTDPMLDANCQDNQLPEMGGQLPDIGVTPAPDEMCPNAPLAMAYVPSQRWRTTYELGKALERGTIFPELDLPFEGGNGR